MKYKPMENHPVQVGNVYEFRAGRPRKEGKRYVVVGISEYTCHCLIISKSGDICGVTSYARHYLAEREKAAFMDEAVAIEKYMQEFVMWEKGF